MPKLTYSAAKGLVQEAGSGVVIESDSVSFTSTPFSPVQTVFGNSIVVTAPGVYAISSSGDGGETVTLPSVTAFPGANFVFRCATADAHILTGSSADQRAVFAGFIQNANGTFTTDVGSKLTFAAVAGTSVVLVSDGNKYCVVGGSGSFSFSESLPA